jgi:hypothetical protein
MLITDRRLAALQARRDELSRRQLESALDPAAQEAVLSEIESCQVQIVLGFRAFGGVFVGGGSPLPAVVGFL